MAYNPPSPGVPEYFRAIRELTRLSALVGWERVTRPVARNLDDVPCDLAAVTAEWMSHVLCAGTPGAEVVSLAAGDGSSGTSERARYALTYNPAGRDAGLPDTVFAKSTPGVLTRMANGLSQTSVAEARFYREIRPILDVEAPKGYHSAACTKTYRSVHLLEDLAASRGAEFCSPTTRIDRDLAEEAIRQMASFHAPLFRDERLQGQFPWLKTYPDWWSWNLRHINIRDTAAKGFEKAEDVVPPALFTSRHRLWEGFIASVDAHNQLPHTLLHGDVHLGNWYITADRRMGLCDWQCVSRGHWSRDLAYAMGAILTVEDRRAWEDDLIRLYIEQFARRGGEAISLEECWCHYRLQLFGALFMWTPTYHHSVFLPDMQPPDVAREMVKRLATALDDHNSMDLI